jgi:arginine decarboxylase
VQPGGRIIVRTTAFENFNVEEATEVYGIENWGAGYFTVTEEGNLAVRPTREDSRRVEILPMVENLRARGISPPLILRFPQLLESQVNELCGSFQRAISEFGYALPYKPVYPIKVNQQRSVVAELLRSGWKYDLGIEVGSKSELVAAVGLEAPPNSLLVCNGFKDDDYLGLASLACRTGRRVVVVVEKPYELERITELFAHSDQRFLLGFRIRLRSRGSGRWEKSGGLTSKFGLSTTQMLDGVNALRKSHMLGLLKMLHFHIGSQVTEIRRLKNAIKEAARVYAKARKMGLDVEYLNVGGGLGVDYDGSRTSSDASVNYSMQEYANDVVYTIKEICSSENVPEPIIISESGRALVAYHSLLVVNIVADLNGRGRAEPEAGPSGSVAVDDLMYILKKLSVKNFREYYHDALEHRDELFSMFNLGYLSLEERARGEQLFWEISRKVVRFARTQKFLADEFVELERQLHEKYVANFSVFQSIPDHWALGQLFPIVPIHRLGERPQRSATLVDISCDSDGEVDKFVDLKDINDALEVHSLGPDPYYMAVFLRGAYQDVMGDMHNLLGATHEAQIVVDETGRSHVQQVRRGNTAGEVLGMFGYQARELLAAVHARLEEQCRNGTLSERDAKRIESEYKGQFERYPYLA